MKALRHIFTTLLALSVWHFLGAQFYSSRQYNHRDGLSSSMISVLKAQFDGGILIGTNGAGIIEYDGYKFRELTSSSVDQQHFVSEIEEYKGKTYFTSQYKGLFLIDETKKVYKVYENSELGDFNAFVIVNDLFVISTASAIVMYDAPTKKTTYITLSKNKDLIVYQSIVSENFVYLLTNKGNFVVNSKTNKLVKLSAFVTDVNCNFSDLRFGYYGVDEINLFDSLLTKKVTIHTFSRRCSFEPLVNLSNQRDIVIHGGKYNAVKNSYIAYTKKGELFEVKQNEVQLISRNIPIVKDNVNGLMIDYKGNYWLSTQRSGIIKIGLRPFTRLTSNAFLQNTQISHIYKSPSNQIVLSSKNYKETAITEILSNEYKRFPFEIKTSATLNDQLMVATNEGLKIYHESSKSFEPIQLPSLKDDKKIQLLYFDKEYLWVYVVDEGLYQFDKDKKLIHYYKQNQTLRIAYTAQISHDKKQLYLGTNNGIVDLDITHRSMKKISGSELGFYCGLSTVDIYGTRWFALENGLFGITRHGLNVSLTDQKYFISYLFYTLNSDNNGNLILGTNKGLNIIQVNEKGEVLNQKNYNASSGFDGYETNMRSSFQYEDKLLLGTVEGVYLVDLSLLNEISPLIGPNIKKIENANGAQATFLVLEKNPRIRSVSYSYRVKFDEYTEWSNPEFTNRIHIEDLPDGKYELEVRSTYNGVSFSPVSTYKFTIYTPFYKSVFWNIALISILLFLMFYFYSFKKFDYSIQDIYFMESSVLTNWNPKLIVFASILNALGSFMVYSYIPELKINLLMISILTIALFILYGVSVYYQNKQQIVYLSHTRALAFTLITIYYIYSIYINDLHPFFGYTLIITISIAPILLLRTRFVIRYVLMVLLWTMVAIYFLKATQHEKLIFMFMLITVCIMIIYISLTLHLNNRQHSLLSTIISKSNILTIAFDQNGTIKHVSKSVDQYLKIDSIALQNKNLIVLKDLIPELKNINYNNLQETINDERAFISATQSSDNKNYWIEWYFKKHSDDFYVLFGQEITEKQELNDTYENIVNNVEDIICKIDLEGKIVFANHIFYNYANLSTNAYIGSSLFDLIDSTFRLKVMRHYRNQIKDKQKVSYIEFPIKAPDGTVKWIGQKATIVFDSITKNAIALLIVGRDITWRIENALLLLEKNKQMEDSLQTIQLVQESLRPKDEIFIHSFDEFFVLNQMNAAISNTFCWSKKIDNHLIAIVGQNEEDDANGVLSTMLLYTFIDALIFERNIVDPGHLLNALDKRIFEFNEQVNKISSKLRLELMVSIINLEDYSMKYATAGGRLLILDHEQPSLHRGNNKFLGDQLPSEVFSGYITNYVNLPSDFTIYYFTNGILNQVGGRENERFSIRRFMEMLNRNVRLPLAVQKEIFNQEIISWTDGKELSTDFILIGLRKKIQ